MGLLRFLLAAAVVLGHAGYVGLLLPYYAVQAFFIVSGFYMALIHTKYEANTARFYINRYSRIAVPFWIVAIVTLAFLRHLSNFPLADKTSIPPLLAWSNIFVFGGDIANFFTVNGETAANWLLVPQGWSLGTELLFYVLVPFLWKMRSRTLIALAVLSLVVRLATLELPFYPWQQKFFPSELFFFLVGMLAYRHQVKVNGWAALGFTLALVAFSGHLQRDPNLAGSLILAAALFVAVPSIFELAKRNALDRFIGEFSYPVYLWQVFVLSAFGYHPIALLWCVLLSIPMVLLVELPLERWRNRSVKGLASASRARSS